MKKGKRHSPTRGKIYLISFLFLCFLSLLWYILPFFLFPLEDLQIIGNSRVSQETIIERLSHLKGKPLFQISKGNISSLVLENRWIKNVEIYKLPPHNLLLKVQERTPFLLVSSEKGTPLLVDEEGYVIENPSQMSGLPSLSLPSLKMRENGRLAIPFFQEIKEILAQLSETPIKIENISLSPDDEIHIFTKGGVEIIIGKPNDLFQKLFILKALWQKTPNAEKRLLYVNLSCVSAPAIMERENK